MKKSRKQFGYESSITDPSDPELRLHQDLRATYTSYTIAGERVWGRFAEHLAQRNITVDNWQASIQKNMQDEKVKSMQFSDVQTMRSQPSMPKRRPQRLFLIAASLVVAAVLVGTLVLTFTVIRPPKQQVSAAAPKQATLTHAVAPQDCFLLPDTVAWNSVCKAGLVQAINQSQHLSNGLTLTLKGAYADQSQVMLWYDATLVNENIDEQGTLTTTQGLPLTLTATEGTRTKHSAWHYQWVAIYTASSLPADLHTASLRASEKTGWWTTGSSNKSAHAAQAVFVFQVSLLPTRVLAPKQTQTVNGISVMLSQIVLSHAGAIVRLLIPQDLTGEFNGVLQIGSQRFHSDQYQPFKARVTQAGLAFVFNSDLTALSGAGTFTLTIGNGQPWIFHFTISS